MTVLVTTSANKSSLSYVTAEAITISNGAILTQDTTDTVYSGQLACVSSGSFEVNNASNTTPIVVILSSNAVDYRFEKNGKFKTRGAPITLGTSSGSASQTFSLASSPLSVIPYPSYVGIRDTALSVNVNPWLVVTTAGKPVVGVQSEYA